MSFLYFCIEMKWLSMKINQLWSDERVRQFARFGVVGLLSSAAHYAIYYLLLFVLKATIAYVIGYVVSFVGNYFFTNCSHSCSSYII